MKPLNLDNSPCSPISSSCVIWQGPNIPCIKLCTGDSITDVVYALATELCSIVDAVNISTLDLSCLEITTGAPTNLNELLQILVNKICELNDISTSTTSRNVARRGNTTCPTDCVVPVAECLQTGGQTTMKLLDYIQLIGNKICSILTDISTINNSITNLTKRVTILESVPPTPPYVLPSVTPDCTLADDTVESGIAYQLDVILEALINDDNHGYCALLSSTGQPSEITTAYLSQPVSGTEVALSNCSQTLDEHFGIDWFSSPGNLSQSFTDLWLTVKDLRDAYKTYTVVSGNSNVTVTPTTNTTACGPELQFSVKAKGSSVVAGSNITVTSNEVDGNTAYTINAAASNLTTVSAGDNVTVTSTNPNPTTTNYEVKAKGVTASNTSSISTTVTTVGNNFNVESRVNDTGWVDLLGFDWFVNSPNWKPQCRRIGNVVYFRGAVMVPLSDGAGGVINYTYSGSGIDTYSGSLLTSPYQGTGGVNIDNDGAIFFNNMASVIPTSVVSAGTNFDSPIWSSNYLTASRYFKFKDATGTVSGFTGILHTVCKIFIYQNKGLGLQILRDNEYSSTGAATNPIGTSALNTLVSRVTVGELCPRWIACDTCEGESFNFTDFHSAPAAALGSGNREVFYANNLRFPFTCDAGQPINLGGFGWIQLEGMTATLAPCNTDVKNTNC